MTALVSPAAERKMIWRVGVGQSVGRQIRRGHNVLDEFSDAQAGEEFDELLHVFRVGREFFADAPPSHSNPAVAG